MESPMETVSLAMLHRTEFGVLFSDPYWEPFDQSWILTPKLIIYDLSALEELLSAGKRTIDNALDTIFANPIGTATAIVDSKLERRHAKKAAR